jgi:hypothetical protein
MIEVKFTGANLDALRRQITHFLDEMDGPGPTVKQPVAEPVAEPVEEPVSGPFPVAAAKDEVPSTPSPAADASGATSAEAPSDVPPYDEVMVAVLDVANAYSKDEALAMLSKFGAKRASDIDPSRWADVIAAAQALLKAA